MEALVKQADKITNEIEYHQDRLLKIVMAINTDFPLGNGMIAQINDHRDHIYRLEAEIITVIDLIQAEE
jgi:hypothetical protein